MESKSKVSSSLVAATIAVLMAVYFATSVFAACKRPEPIPPPPSPGGDIATTNGLPFSRIMLAGEGLGDSEDGCNGSTCNGTDPCCSGCLCIPLLGRSDGICFGICCILASQSN